MAKKLLHVKALVNTKANNDEGIIEAVVGSTSVIDRMGDTINQAGWDLKNFKKNPVILWGHNVREERPPIGKAIKVWLEGTKEKKLMFRVKFDLQDKFASEIFRKIKDGFINTTSVGFMPLEWDDNEFTSMDLLELSFVPVPANPEALVAIKDLNPIELKKMYKPKDLGDFKNLKVIKHKRPIPYKNLDTAPVSEVWDGPKERANSDVDMLKLICAWFDDTAPQKKSSYLLAHHNATTKKAVWRGVASSMAVLMGGKGGVDIPEKDRKDVYNHLAKHYKQFDREAPEFKAVEKQVLKGLDEEIHALILDREDKHVVRLLKQLIKITKTKQNSKEHDAVKALRVLDGALEQIKGGE